MNIPTFATKKELFDFLVTNKQTLIATKKSQIKHADGFSGMLSTGIDHKGTNKAVDNGNMLDLDEVVVKAVINTTNVFDSHKDVHIDGIWGKSLSDNKRGFLHLQEHNPSYDYIIAAQPDVKAYVVKMSFNELGYNLTGNTEALIFESKVRKSVNPKMFERYVTGQVLNHSVGMRYIKVGLAINDDNYPAEKTLWDKYIGVIANKSDAEDAGYFWAVTEAQVVEGSAVPMGSNYITPSLSVEPPKGTNNKQEPTSVTPEQAREIIKSILNKQS